MERLTIDLSGVEGLVPNYQGDLNDTTSKPHLRYIGSDGQMAEGIFDPMRIQGYMSPSNNKYADLTGTADAAFISRIYDSSSNKLYLAQNGDDMSTVSGLDGTSFSTEFSLSTSGSIFRDVELYEINGEKAIWYAWEHDTNGSDNMSVGFIATDSTRGMFQLSSRVFDSGVSNTADETIVNGGNEQLAQKFRTQDLVVGISVNGIRLRLFTSGGISQTWTLRVGIQTDTAGRPSGTWAVGGTCFVDIDPNTLPQSYYEYVYATFASTMNLDPATTYHIVVAPTSYGDLSGSEGVTWLRTDGDGTLYSNGEAEQYIAAAWADADTTNESFDFALILRRLNLWTARDGVSAPYTFNATRADSTFLEKADNGYLYWFVDNMVHRIDGGSTGGDYGSFTEQVLRFPDYITCMDAVDTNSLMYIGIQSSPVSGATSRNFGADVCGIYVWDRLSAVASIRNYLPIYGAREIKKVFVNPDGEVRIITIGEDKFTEIRGISGGRVIVLKKLGLDAYPVYRHSLSYINNMATWLGADGIIYAFGRLQPEMPKERLYKIGTINGEVSGTLSSGIVYAGHNETTQSRDGLFISWSDNGGRTLTKWYPHGTGTISSVAQTGAQGDVFSKQAFLPTLSTIKSIEIVCIPNGAAADTTTVATIKFYANQSTTPFASKTVTRDDISKGYLQYELNKPYVTAFQMEVEWSTSQTLGSNDFNPAYAILYYQPTGTAKGEA